MSISQYQITGNTAETIYLSTKNTAITTIYICNTSTSQLTFTLGIVPSGEIPSPQNTIYFETPLGPKDTFIVDTERLILGDADSIKLEVPAFDSNIDGVVTTTISYVSI